MSDVLHDRDGPVTILTLNRPERLNAWTYDLGDLYFDLLDEAGADPEVRAIVVTGAGRGFCSGMDGAQLTASSSGQKRMPAKGRRMTHALSIRKRIVGHTRAMELALSSRKIDAKEAERIGLVNFVVPDAELLPRAIAWAKDVAAECSPIAMADAKRQIHDAWNQTCTEAEDWAKELGHLPGHRVDFPEGAASLKEKRKPNFAPLPPKG